MRAAFSLKPSCLAVMHTSPLQPSQWQLSLANPKWGLDSPAGLREGSGGSSHNISKPELLFPSLCYEMIQFPHALRSSTR